MVRPSVYAEDEEEEVMVAASRLAHRGIQNVAVPVERTQALMQWLSYAGIEALMK